MKLFFLIAILVHFTAQASVQFPSDFFFGIANAPAHVEDNLSDIWIDFADDGGVAAYHNQVEPERRLDFWSKPEVELDLAKELGVQVFRLGVDWGRLQPRPGQELDLNVLKRYREIIEMVHARGMKVMLTLFHHTEPRWTLNRGSWREKEMIYDFVYFAQTVLEYLGDKIDYLVTFNEAQVYIMLSQVGGVWPTQGQARGTRLFDIGPIKGSFTSSLKNMASAHKKIFNWMKARFSKVPVGIAHNIAYYKGDSFLFAPFAAFSRARLNHFFTDQLIGYMDYLGLNYYGLESIKGTATVISDKYEYSDSGRAVYPTGFYKLLKDMYKRYELPIIITENGVADSRDWLRPAYIVEHLRAVKAAMDEGVKVLGYIHWTLSDNWEWADGYCPKFGLVAVDRSNNMKRVKRDSFNFYQSIIKQGGISAKQIDDSWKRAQSNIGQNREFCRASDGVGSLDEPILMPARNIDWRLQTKP